MVQKYQEYFRKETIREKKKKSLLNGGARKEDYKAKKHKY